MTAKLPHYDDPLISEIQQHIVKRMERIKLELVTNGAADYAAYRFKTGQYDGLQQALFSIDDAIKHFGIEENL